MGRAAAGAAHAFAASRVGHSAALMRPADEQVLISEAELASVASRVLREVLCSSSDGGPALQSHLRSRILGAGEPHHSRRAGALQAGSVSRKLWARARPSPRLPSMPRPQEVRLRAGAAVAGGPGPLNPARLRPLGALHGKRRRAPAVCGAGRRHPPTYAASHQLHAARRWP